jgi:hypothetical protein
MGMLARDTRNSLDLTEVKLPSSRLPTADYASTRERFRETVIRDWISKDADSAPAFYALEQDGRVRFEVLPAGSLRQRELKGEIMYRENFACRDKLQAITLPLDPNTLSRPDAVGARGNGVPGPAILVEVDKELVVANGNHRMHKVINENPGNSPLLAVVFESPAAFAEYAAVMIQRCPNGRWGHERLRVVDRFAPRGRLISA